MLLTTNASFTASWVAATALCIWFLWIHAPTFLSTKDYIQPLLYFHLIGVYSIYLICVHNTMLTPSALNGAAKPFHIWLGRVGLILGVFGFATGFILVWFVYDFSQNWGFSIGITYGGFAQMQLEILGWKSIKKFQMIKAQINAGEYKDREELVLLQDEQEAQLTAHIQSMIRLFVLACGIPALLRICDVVGYGYLPLFLIIVYSLTYFMTRPFLKRMEDKRTSERNHGNSEYAQLK